MRVALLTKEWPPAIYGGAGVHVTQLAKALRTEGVDLEVHCFGEPRTDAIAYGTPVGFSDVNPALAALATDLAIANALNAELFHSHTWYANLAGHVGGLLHGRPHVITAHSLEPRRPWKAEQLGGGYRISSWAEKTAYEGASAIIAVSDGMRSDVLDVYPELDAAKVFTVRNGVDTDIFKPNHDASVLEEYGISTEQPFALFVGRITRQKGLAHLLRAWQKVNPDIGLVLAAGAADEEAIGAEIEELVAKLQTTRSNIIWIRKMLTTSQLTSLLTSARVFVCPSIYEPLGIVNLEAMACATAVVASAVGGIPEVVSHGVTGELVPYGDHDDEFESALATSINRVAEDPELAKRYGEAGRERVVAEFGWSQVAKATIEIYERVLTA
ncbi:capsular glucan synthase [mine drainage metagenome]|uniref:Capsular glucan synthase n=1 Tax=mine drainage metagenome TaxID=410659 RepID=A0A1J5Q4H6_9ZZZZ